MFVYATRANRIDSPGERMLVVPVLAPEQQQGPAAVKHARTGRSRSADEQVVTQVKVTQPYLLQWRARTGVPALQMLLPPAAFGGWRRAELSTAGQTADDTEMIDLEVLAPGPSADSAPPQADICSVATLATDQCGFGRGRLSLYRDNLRYPSDIKELLDGRETVVGEHGATDAMDCRCRRATHPQ